MKILFAVHHLESFAGSEVMTLELTRCALALGMEVEVAAFYLSDALAQKFAELGVTPRDLLADTDMLTRESFDIVWLCHYPVVDYLAGTLQLPASTWIRAVLSPFEPLEALSGLEGEFDAVIANSEETASAISSSVAKERLHTFVNSAPAEYFAISPLPDRPLGRVLVVSNHVPGELRQALEELRRRGIHVREIGRDGEVKLLEPDDIANVDAVITIGKTVQYALAAGRPVFCYDRFGGPGWLTLDNLSHSARLNFSGRGYGRLSAKQIETLIVEGHAGTVVALPSLKKVASDEYSFERNFAALLQGLRDTDGRQRTIGNDEAARRGKAYAALVSAHRHARNLCVEQAAAASERAAIVDSLRTEIDSLTRAADEERAISQGMLADATESAQSLQRHLDIKEGEVLELTRVATEERARRLELEQQQDAQRQALEGIESDLAQERVTREAMRILHDHRLAELGAELVARSNDYEKEVTSLRDELASLQEKYDSAERILGLIKRRLKYFPLLLSGIENREQRNKGKA